MKVLNGGLLPGGFYAQAEQVAREIGPDLLTLQSSADQPRSGFDHAGMTAVADAPPEVSFTETLDEVDYYALKRKSLFIRHASGDH